RRPTPCATCEPDAPAESSSSRSPIPDEPPRAPARTTETGTPLYRTGSEPKDTEMTQHTATHCRTLLDGYRRQQTNAPLTVARYGRPRTAGARTPPEWLGEDAT